MFLVPIRCVCFVGCRLVCCSLFVSLLLNVVSGVNVLFVLLCHCCVIVFMFCLMVFGVLFVVIGLLVVVLFVVISLCMCCFVLFGLCLLCC